MTVSDSLPIQLWPVASETFNEKEICGVTAPKCFCQPIDCTGQQILQFIGDPSSTPIIDLSTSSANGGDVDWTLTSDPTVEVSGGGPFSYYLYTPIATLTGNTYRFGYDVTFSSSIDPSLQDSRLFIHVLDGAFNSLDSFSVAVSLSQPLNQSGVVEVVPTGNGTYIALEYRTLDGPAIRVTINEFTVNSGYYTVSIKDENDAVYFTEDFTEVSSGVYQVTVDFTAASPSICGLKVVANVLENGVTPFLKSDCLDTSEAECFVDISYTNSSDFDYLVYEISPQPEFSIRIPALFYQEENPQEREDLELSNRSIVSLRKTIAQKRLLETGFMPAYMHLKLQKILMHDTITIDGENWIMRDPYETNIIKDYPLKKAEVWLTKVDSIERNII